MSGYNLFCKETSGAFKKRNNAGREWSKLPHRTKSAYSLRALALQPRVKSAVRLYTQQTGLKNFRMLPREQRLFWTNYANSIKLRSLRRNITGVSVFAFTHKGKFHSLASFRQAWLRADREKFRAEAKRINYEFMEGYQRFLAVNRDAGTGMMASAKRWSLLSERQKQQYYAKPSARAMAIAASTPSGRLKAAAEMRQGHIAATIAAERQANLLRQVTVAERKRARRLGLQAARRKRAAAKRRIAAGLVAIRKIRKANAEKRGAQARLRLARRLMRKRKQERGKLLFKKAPRKVSPKVER